MYISTKHKTCSKLAWGTLSLQSLLLCLGYLNVGDWLCFLETEQFLNIRKSSLGDGSCQLQKEKLSIDPIPVSEGLLLHRFQ